MFNEDQNIEVATKVTGFVLPVGNGAVGKSSFPFALNINKDNNPRLSKTINIEFGYVSHLLEFQQKHYQILQQYLVPPGQKESEGLSGGRSYENIIETYRFLFRQIDVVLLTFNLTELETFNDLEFWVDQSLTLSNIYTQFFLVGTHVDLDHARQVTPKMINTGLEFIQNRIIKLNPFWIGQVLPFEVSNTNGQNLAILRNAISLAILRAKKVII